MRFVPVLAENQVAGADRWWRITVTDALDVVTGNATIVDGTAYDKLDGVTEVNPNDATLGTVGAVGTGPDGVTGTADEPTLTGLNGPELEIVGTGTIEGISIGAGR